MTFLNEVADRYQSDRPALNVVQRLTPEAAERAQLLADAAALRLRYRAKEIEFGPITQISKTLAERYMDAADILWRRAMEANRTHPLQAADMFKQSTQLSLEAVGADQKARSRDRDNQNGEITMLNEEELVVVESVT